MWVGESKAWPQASVDRWFDGIRCGEMEWTWIYENGDIRRGQVFAPALPPRAEKKIRKMNKMEVKKKILKRWRSRIGKRWVEIKARRRKCEKRKKEKLKRLWPEGGKELLCFYCAAVFVQFVGNVFVQRAARNHRVDNHNHTTAQ